MDKLLKCQGRDLDSDKDGGDPCARHLVEAPMPFKFRMPMMDSYDGTTDTTNHLARFNRQMMIHKVSEDVRCTCFPLTFTEATSECFKKYKSETIHS